MPGRRQPAGGGPCAVQHHPACAAPGALSRWRCESWNAKYWDERRAGSDAGNVQGNIQNKVAVLIAGPTASGKSALALAVAEYIGGIVVNTDSMQVYRDLMIITA